MKILQRLRKTFIRRAIKNRWVAGQPSQIRARGSHGTFPLLFGLHAVI